MSAATSTVDSQALARAPSPAKSLADWLNEPRAKAELESAAKSFMRADEMIRLALMATSRQPELLRCSARSILRALMDAAALRIAPGGVMGRGYLVPRKNKHNGEIEACFDPGWRGLADIAKRSGLVRRIDAMVVYQGDRFEFRAGTNPDIVHNPSMDLLDEDQDSPLIIGAYAIATFENGDKQHEVLRKSDIERIRATSMSANGPWSAWYDEMARKSAVRRLCKYLPYDPVLERALEHATDAESGVRTVIDMSARPAAPSLEDALSASDAPALPEPAQTVSGTRAAQAPAAVPVAAASPPPTRQPRAPRSPKPELAEAAERTIPIPGTEAPPPADRDPREVPCSVCGSPVLHGIATYIGGKRGTRHAACAPPKTDAPLPIPVCSICGKPCPSGILTRFGGQPGVRHASCNEFGGEAADSPPPDEWQPHDDGDAGSV